MTNSWKFLILFLCSAALLLAPVGCGKDKKSKEKDAGPDGAVASDTDTDTDTDTDIDTDTDTDTDTDADADTGEKCTADSCSGHGVCSETADGETECECDEGYAGDNCSDCAEGYHRILDNTCEEDVGSADVQNADGVCSNWAMIACHNALQCCTVEQIQDLFGEFLEVEAWNTLEACVRDMVLACEVDLQEFIAALKAGRLNLNLANMNACLNGLLAPDGECLVEAENYLEATAACHSVVTGGQAVDEKCEEDIECEQTDAGPDRYCGRNDKCMETVGENDACHSDTQSQEWIGKICGINLRCVNGICKKLANLAEDCFPWLWPDFSTDKAPPPSPGNDGLGCVDDLMCEGWYFDNSPTQGGEEDAGPPVAGTCVEPEKGYAEKGEPCKYGNGFIDKGRVLKEDLLRCEPSLVCVPGFCGPYFCYGDDDANCMGKCQGAMMHSNDPCVTSEECEKGRCKDHIQKKGDTGAMGDNFCNAEEPCDGLCINDLKDCNPDGGGPGCEEACKSPREPGNPMVPGYLEECLVDGGCPKVCEKSYKRPILKGVKIFNDFKECEDPGDGGPETCPQRCTNSDEPCDGGPASCTGHCSELDDNCSATEPCDGICAPVEGTSPTLKMSCKTQFDCLGTCSFSGTPCAFGMLVSMFYCGDGDGTCVPGTCGPQTCEADTCASVACVADACEEQTCTPDPCYMEQCIDAQACVGNICAEKESSDTQICPVVSGVLSNWRYYYSN